MKLATAAQMRELDRQAIQERKIQMTRHNPFMTE